jgi:hypothetical protein
MSENFRNIFDSSLNLSQNTRQLSTDIIILMFTSLLNMYNDNARILESLLRTNNEMSQSLINIINIYGSQSSREDSTNGITSGRTNYHTNGHINIQNRQPPNLFNYDISSNFFDPVSIHPTDVQIESATRIIRYGDQINPLNNTCCFTLEYFNEEDYVMMIRYCRHVFTRHSLNRWFINNCRCPICRYDIRDYNNINNTLNIPIITQPSHTHAVGLLRSLNSTLISPIPIRRTPITSLNDISNISHDSLTNLLLTGLINSTIVDASNNYNLFG